MSFRKFYDGHEQLNEETPYDRKQRAMVVSLSQHIVCLFWYER